MMQNYFRINVSHNGLYLFATEQGHLTRMQDAKRVYNLLRHKFPEKDGYKVDCRYWNISGEEVNF